MQTAHGGVAQALPKVDAAKDKPTPSSKSSSAPASQVSCGHDCVCCIAQECRPDVNDILLSLVQVCELPTSLAHADELVSFITSRQPLPAVVTIPSAWWDINPELAKALFDRMSGFYLLGPFSDSAVWFLSPSALKSVPSEECFTVQMVSHPCRMLSVSPACLQDWWERFRAAKQMAIRPSCWVSQPRTRCPWLITEPA